MVMSSDGKEFYKFKDGRNTKGKYWKPSTQKKETKILRNINKHKRQMQNEKTH